MKNVRKSFAVLAAAGLLFSCSGVALAADQVRDRDRDQTKDKDGSCQAVVEQQTSLSQLVAKYGADKTGKGDMDQKRDGSCLDS